jgi:hypothetical protein
MKSSIKNLALPWLALALAACGARPPVPPLDLAQSLPPVAAEFRTTVEPAQGGKSSAQWRFWRSHDRIERENPAAQSGDLWVRDDRTLFHTRLYHADRRGIEYRSEDLQILNASPDWAALATMLDPRLVVALHERASGWHDGYPYRRYTGSIGEAAWDITVRTDWMLPTRIVRRGADRKVETVELLQSYELGKSPWQPAASADYEIIDYADLGDHERDPFVMRVQAEEGGGHLHGHAH